MHVNPSWSLLFHFIWYVVDPNIEFHHSMIDFPLLCVLEFWSNAPFRVYWRTPFPAWIGGRERLIHITSDIPSGPLLSFGEYEDVGFKKERWCHGAHLLISLPTEPGKGMALWPLVYFFPLLFLLVSPFLISFDSLILDSYMGSKMIKSINALACQSS